VEQSLPTRLLHCQCPLVLDDGSLTQHVLPDVGRLHGQCLRWSGTGITDWANSTEEGEYEAAGDSILDTFRADLIDGVGATSRDLDVDKDHQWASVVTMLAPSLDRMAGVANLRLCDGHDWKRYVKVCAELFSTATKSDRFFPPMQRNTIQWNNCSFGYFEFTFKEYEGSTQEPPENCEFGK